MNHQSNRGSHLPSSHPRESGTYVAVGVKHCCGVLINDVCDCAAFEATAFEALHGRNAIMCRPAREWTQPADALGIGLHRIEHAVPQDGCVLCETVKREQAVA